MYDIYIIIIYTSVIFNILWDQTVVQHTNYIMNRYSSTLLYRSIVLIVGGTLSIFKRALIMKINNEIKIRTKISWPPVIV